MHRNIISCYWKKNNEMLNCSYERYSCSPVKNKINTFNNSFSHIFSWNFLYAIQIFKPLTFTHPDFRPAPIKITCRNEHGSHTDTKKESLPAPPPLPVISMYGFQIFTKCRCLPMAMYKSVWISFFQSRMEAASILVQHSAVAQAAAGSGLKQSIVQWFSLLYRLLKSCWIYSKYTV